MYAKFVGISAETAAFIERRRQNPQESEDDIINRELRPKSGARSSGTTSGCDLGEGAVLNEGEKLYLFRYKSSRVAGKPEAVAEAKGGNLFLYGARVEPSKSSLLQPALTIWQKRNNDRNEKGVIVSLNAWIHWYVNRGGQYVAAGELRAPEKIVRRGRTVMFSHLTTEEMGL